MFLVRCAFWLTLVVAFVPLSDDSANAVNAPSALETLQAARLAANDLSGICQRQPEVCYTGRQVADVLREKARTGVDLISQWLEQRDTQEAAGADTLLGSDRAPVGRLPNPA